MKSKGKYSHLRLFLTLLFIFFSSNNSFACGTLRNWVNAYYGKGPIGEESNQKQALIGIYLCATSYYAGEGSDRIILPVVIDALNNNDIIDKQSTLGIVDKDGIYNAPGSVKYLIEGIYLKYKCLAGTSDLAGYKRAVTEFGTKSCLKKGSFRQTKNSFFVRMAPSGKTVGHIKTGTKFNVLKEIENGWLKIIIPANINSDSLKYPFWGFIHSAALLQTNENMPQRHKER